MIFIPLPQASLYYRELNLQKGLFLGIKKAKSLPNVKLPNINDFSLHKKLSVFIGTDPSV